MSADAPDSSDIHVDVVIVGGGMVGATLAVALGGTGLDVALIDRLDPGTMADAPFDGRASSIAYASQRALVAMGAWKHMAANAQAILDIRVSEGDSLLFLHYDHRDLGDGPFGYMVENRDVRRGLFAALAQLPAVRLFAPAELEELRRTDDGVAARLSGGRTISGRLAIAADGRNSPVRESAGIRVQGWTYAQSGIVCTVAHEFPHRGVAHERFLAAGPFAILPLTGNRASLVWTEPTRVADRLISLDEDAFNDEMRERFGDFLGHSEVAGPRWCYPLALPQRRVLHRPAIGVDR